MVRQATHDAFFSMKAVKLSGIQIFGWEENTNKLLVVTKFKRKVQAANGGMHFLDFS